ncbi:porin [Oceanisphaera avium]|uniref:Porin domain-containing protein n=1 Tax=Oceanisphaera avium TaxID=1903694 RepID=A0A1Y0D046_9GAMM|nr:porin [Oceanisphaera avium]ART80614.1 hypothetical protein CBP12_11060 [Oceanisphaera avium]
MMKAILLCCLFITQPVWALTLSSSDNLNTLSINARYKYQMGALAYQYRHPNKAQAFGGSDQLSLGLIASRQLNPTVTLIGEMSWDVFNETQADAQLYADQAWLGARFYDRLELTVGRSESPVAQVADLTDVFNIFGGQGYRYQELTLDDQIKVSFYNNNLDIRAAYAVYDQSKQDSTLNLRTQSAASLGYRADNGLGMVLALDHKSSYDLDSDINSIAMGISYINKQGLYAAISHNRSYYQRAWDVRELTSWESVISYSFNQLAIGVGYNRLSLAKPEQQTWTDEYIIAAEYYLIPQAKIYSEVLLNQVEDKEPLYGIGMQYYF